MRGEYGFSAIILNGTVGSPPLARGIHDLSPRNRQMPGITPRLRGEYLNDSIYSLTFCDHPPLARGIQESRSLPLSLNRITPACAGNTPGRTGTAVLHEDHPRLRGEYADVLCSFRSSSGSPPLARGILAQLGRVLKPVRITPACAGNTVLPALRPCAS